MNASQSKNSEWDRISGVIFQEPEKLSHYEKLIETAENNGRKGVTKTSSEEELQILRASYETILDRFPLLTHYWIRYARWELRLENPMRARGVFRRGLQYLDRSIDLWCKYLQLLVDTTSNNVNEVLAEFEAARVKIGLHFHAYDFYKMYLGFLKSYIEEENGFRLKYHTLLRMVIEIPLYHYEYFFKEFFDHLGDVTQATLPYFLSSNDLSNYTNINDKLLSSKLKKVFTDLYITMQLKVYQLYYYERKLSVQCFTDKCISSEEQMNWDNYLSFIELHYPVNYTILVYERAVYANCNYHTFWIRYANLYIMLNRLPAAVEVIQRGIRLCSSCHYELILKLVDLQIYLKDFLKARDILLSYIATSISIPLPIYERLANIESLIHPNDHDYLISLFTELINQTNSDWFFKIICYYSIPTERILGLFDKFRSNFQDSKIYNECLVSVKTGMGALKLNSFHEEMQEYSIET